MRPRARPPESVSFSSPLALAGDYQELNAALALSLVHYFLHPSPAATSLPPPTPLPLTPAMRAGLAKTSWPGRAQKIQGALGLPSLTLYLDGGHTEASLLASARWWLQEMRGVGEGEGEGKGKEKGTRVLVFTCKQSKPAASLLAALLEAHAESPYDLVFFVAAKVRHPRDPSNALSLNLLHDEDKTPQRLLHELWLQGGQARALSLPPAELHAAIDDTLAALSRLARSSPSPVHVHVTGSLYLVGGFLDALGMPL